MNSNPFKLTGYLGAEYFCDREMESEKLLSAILNQRNLTLFSIRRMGKTGLIWHVFDQLKSGKHRIPVYVDIMPTLNLYEFSQSFAKAVLTALAQKQSMLKKLMTAMAALRPTLTYDPLTGTPEVSVKVDAESAEHSLESLFHLLEKQDNQFVIAFDEFQQIALYPEQHVEALLRSHMQKLNNVVFIFSGSRRHLLNEIFSSPHRPFFNSTEKMEISSIGADIYKKFIEYHFHKNKKKIHPDALDEIERLTSLHTFYVQFLCNRLYSTGQKNIGKQDAEFMFRQVIAENESIYAGYLNLITPLQFRLVKAIAKEKGSEFISSRYFLTKHNLGAASSVSTAIKSLSDKDFVYQDNGKYYLIDKFFEGWLKGLD